MTANPQRRARLSARLWARVGRRGSALLFFGLLDLVYSVSLFAPEPVDSQLPAVRYLAGIAPLWAFGALWLAAGILCLLNAFRHNDRVGYAAAIMIKLLWGLLLLFGQLLGAVQRGWLSAAIWLSLGVFVFIISTWPEVDSSLLDYPVKRR